MPELRRADRVRRRRCTPSECPFCASPIVTDTGVSRQIKPQAQLPFLLSEDAGARRR